MADYEIVAFYREHEAEIAKRARIVGEKFRLRVRYEKLPGAAGAITALLEEKTVFCMLARETIAFFKLMKYVYALDRPVLVVDHRMLPEACDCLKVPVGYLQENREKVVWANFLQRHHPACRIELVVPQERDEGIAEMVSGNLGFIENILKKSEARYVATFTKVGYERSLKEMFGEREECVVLMMRPFRIFAFYFPYAVRLFRRYGHAPVLFVPRNDSLYIPCH